MWELRTYLGRDLEAGNWTTGGPLGGTMTIHQIASELVVKSGARLTAEASPEA
jgi:hypothetical protein